MSYVSNAHDIMTRIGHGCQMASQIGSVAIILKDGAMLTIPNHKFNDKEWLNEFMDQFFPEKG